MQERNLRVLEYPKILERLAAMAMTEPGKAAARALRPSGDINEVRRLQQETEEALSAYAYHGGSPMAYFSDVSEYLQLAKVGSTLSMKALLTIAEGLRAARTVRNALVSDREDTRTLSAIASELATNRPLEEEIFNAILSEDEMADRASPELYDIRRRLRALNDRVRDRLNAIIRSSSLQKYLQDAIITMRNGRYVIPVRADSRQYVPGLVHDQSGSGSTLFIEPAAVVVHAVEKAKEIFNFKHGSYVLVQGCGPIGLLLLTLVRTMGVRNIIAVDGDEKRLAMAKKLGAAYTVNFLTEDAIAKVKELTEGKGAEMAFQCTGSPKAAGTIWKYVRRGGSMCELGFFVNNGDATYNPHFDICNKEIKVTGSWTYQAKDWMQACEFLKEAQIDELPVTELLTHKYALADINDAMEMNISMQGLKIVVKGE